MYQVKKLRLESCLSTQYNPIRIKKLFNCVPAAITQTVPRVTHHKHNLILIGQLQQDRIGYRTHDDFSNPMDILCFIQTNFDDLHFSVLADIVPVWTNVEVARF